MCGEWVQEGVRSMRRFTDVDSSLPPIMAVPGVLTPRSRRNAGRPILGFPSVKDDDDGDDWD